MSSSVTIRSFTRLGSALAVLGLARFGSCASVLDMVVIGSALSLRSYGRLSSAMALLGVGFFASSQAVLDFVILGSSLSLRSFARFGGSMAMLDFLHLGSSLSLRNFLRLGDSVSLGSKLAFSASQATYIQASNDQVLHYANGQKVLTLKTDAGGGPSGVLHGVWEAEQWPTISDRRLKRDVQHLGVALSVDDEVSTRSLAHVVRELRPVSYRLKRGSEGKQARPRFGFIAQELEKHLPEVVLTDRESGLRSVMYQDLIAVLTLALQAQDKEVRSLRQDVDRLKATVTALQSDLRSFQHELASFARRREAGNRKLFFSK
jgi:hypothetical protein